MACEAKLQLNEGESINISLPSINSYDEASKEDLLRLVASIISNNSELKEQVSDLISKSKAKKNRYHVASFDADSGLPIGNTNIKEIVHKYNNDEITAYEQGLLDLGVDLNQNILLLSTQFYTNFISKGGIFTRDGYSVVILEDNIDTVKGYLKYLYITNWLSKNSDNWRSKDIMSKTEELLNKLNDKYKDHNRSFMYSSLVLIEQSGYQEFWKYLLLSPKFRDEVTNFQEGKELIRLLNGLINPEEMLPRTAYNTKEVQEFISKIKEDIISRKDIDDFMKKYEFNSEQDLLYYLNGKDANLEIVLSNERGVLFKRLDSVTPSKDKMDSNSSELDYKGSLVSRLYYSEPYSIYSDNGQFYVTDKYAATQQNLVTVDIKNIYDSYKKALDSIKSKLKTDKINFKSYRTLFKWGKPVTTLSEDDIFQALDVKIDPTIELLEDDSKLFSELKTIVGTRQSRFISDIIKKPQYSTLNTIERIETFFLLKAKNFDKNEYTKLKNKEERQNYIKTLEAKTLAELDSLKTATFRVTKVRDNGECIIEKVNHEENYFGSNSSFTPKDNTQQIVDISERVSKLLGVNVNLINSSELDKYPWLKGNEKAFVYNGEIYINLSLADPKDVLHEYGHLILGSIKQRNLQLYNILVNKVENLPDFNVKLEELKKLYGNNRLEQDLKEEIFVEEFAKVADINTQKQVKAAIKTIFGLKSELNATSLLELESMTFNDLLLNFGSIVLKEPEIVFNTGLSTTSRVMSNMMEKLMELGTLKEDCNG